MYICFGLSELSRTFLINAFSLFPQASSKLLFLAIIIFPSHIMLQPSFQLGWFWKRTTRSLLRHIITNHKALNSLTMQETLHAWSSGQGTRCLCTCLQNLLFGHLADLPPLVVFWSVCFKKWSQKPAINWASPVTVWNYNQSKHVA